MSFVFREIGYVPLLIAKIATYFLPVQYLR